MLRTPRCWFLVSASIWIQVACTERNMLGEHFSHFIQTTGKIVRVLYRSLRSHTASRDSLWFTSNFTFCNLSFISERHWAVPISNFKTTRSWFQNGSLNSKTEGGGAKKWGGGSYWWPWATIGQVHSTKATNEYTIWLAIGCKLIAESQYMNTKYG